MKKSKPLYFSAQGGLGTLALPPMSFGFHKSVRSAHIDDTAQKLTIVRKLIKLSFGHPKEQPPVKANPFPNWRNPPQ